MASVVRLSRPCRRVSTPFSSTGIAVRTLHKCGPNSCLSFPYFNARLLSHTRRSRDLVSRSLVLLFTGKSNFLRNSYGSRSDARDYTQKSAFHRIPPNSWDSHMHVVDPKNYPLAASALYTPTPHSLSQAMNFEHSVGLNSIVLVQPSIYGNDNSCMLDALKKLGLAHGRAVVTFDPTTISVSTLQEWHNIGVRGLRINLQSVGKVMDSSELASTLHQYADVIRPFDWVLQLYVPLIMAQALEKIVPELDVKVCIDHFGHPSLPTSSSPPSKYSLTQDPYTLPGFSSLINLLSQGSTYVKLSAPYRISKAPGQVDLEPVARELLRTAGKSRVVFATDWPHTRFEGLDIRPFMETVLEWCGDDDLLVERLFRGNAEELWDVQR